MDGGEGAAEGRAPARAFDPAAAWADGVITPAEGARFLADLGFELVHGDRPDRPAGANLLVAFRAAPTLHHFDPERLDYWSAEAGRGVRRQVDRDSDQPGHAIAWGTASVVDRLGVSNLFFTFGGRIRLGDVDPATRIAVLGSEAPILRAGGHSQGKDVRADEVGAFFARLRAVVGADVALEARALAAPPLVLYAALIADVRARTDGHHALADARPGYAAWGAEEWRKLASAAPDILAAGVALLEELGLDPA
ncbi:MAG: hypothetical protein MUE82_02050 [Chloroflexi bacterium]|jgi:hypothetical protein|nr:hypothetical protein [Chloroflexota bacterium]